MWLPVRVAADPRLHLTCRSRREWHPRRRGRECLWPSCLRLECLKSIRAIVRWDRRGRRNSARSRFDLPQKPRARGCRQACAAPPTQCAFGVPPSTRPRTTCPRSIGSSPPPCLARSFQTAFVPRVRNREKLQAAHRSPPSSKSPCDTMSPTPRQGWPKHAPFSRDGHDAMHAC